MLSGRPFTFIHFHLRLHFCPHKVPTLILSVLFLSSPEISLVLTLRLQAFNYHLLYTHTLPTLPELHRARQHVACVVDGRR